MAWWVEIGGFGVLVTWLMTAYHGRRRHPPNPVVSWLPGVAALFPAWTITLLDLAWTRP